MPKDNLHAKLVEASYKWVLKNTSCGVALKELNTACCNREYPDVIGFGSGCHSVLIECKTSRSDFLADRKKPFRQNPEFGMGSKRFYCCPADLIKKEELPEGWGLLYLNEKGKIEEFYSPYKGNIGERAKSFNKNIRAEHEVLYSALRRIFKR